MTPNRRGHMASYIGRRKFLATLGGAAAWPLAARAQQSMPVIGLLYGAQREPIEHRLRAFHQGLKESGFIEGDNVAIVYRFVENGRARMWTGSRVATVQEIRRRHLRLC